MNLITAFNSVISLAAAYGAEVRCNPKTRRAVVEFPNTLPKHVADQFASEFINLAHGYGLGHYDRFTIFNDSRSVLVDLTPEVPSVVSPADCKFLAV